ncbi:MAG: murein L,D-transpeptidase [Chloroflexi bacterium]|nr:MAG: murein L,D-transpeptidase [Chloroflexota bacterium]
MAFSRFAFGERRLYPSDADLWESREDRIPGGPAEGMTRRDFLKSAGLALGALWFPHPPGERALPSRRKPRGWGRVTVSGIRLHEEPSRRSRSVDWLPRDTVVPIFAEVEGEAYLPHNAIWFETEGGYLYSSWVQPVRRDYHWRWRTRIPEAGLWGQITVPYADTHRRPDEASPVVYRLYYSSVHRIVAAERDSRGYVWYRLRDDLMPGLVQWVLAYNVRIIPYTELTPIAVGVPDKWIEVHLKEQRLIAYEGKREVFTCRVSTGTIFRDALGGLRDFRTPVGNHQVVRKTASRHMRGGTPGVDFYDLPGVPFTTYFTWTGVAIHGTYWHNDFGRPRSHGCVNVPTDAALWVFRWTSPYVPYRKQVVYARNGGGTPVAVVQA